MIPPRSKSSSSRLRSTLHFLPILLIAGAAHAAHYEVGPARHYKTLQQVTSLLHPGDFVTVDGGATYPGGVTLDAMGAAGQGIISITGVRVNGARPLLSGVSAQGGAVLRVFGSHYLIRGFDMTSGGDPRAARCFYNVGDDVTLRDTIVHDCPFTGISGSDASGSLTLDRIEVCRCGAGLYSHQIYVGSSLAKYPHALFRMQYCYLHDGAGGNNVKSRVTRNQIDYNWIEGAFYHELDLVGPDPKAQKSPKDGIHCDADIIGNVFVKTPASKGTVARFGTDGTASSRGRYRFVNNTVIVNAKPAAAFGLFWLKGQVDSLLVTNNVFWGQAGPLTLVRNETAPLPVPPPTLSGNGNWLPQGTTHVPPEWKAIRGSDPFFTNPGVGDYRPLPGSPLIGAGVTPPPPAAPAGIPPTRKIPPDGELLRPPSRKRDIGAYPFLPSAS